LVTKEESFLKIIVGFLLGIADVGFRMLDVGYRMWNSERQMKVVIQPGFQ